MNAYCKSALNQIKIALQKTAVIMDHLSEDDLSKRPTPTKHSIGELLEHIALICKADLLIASEATQAEMEEFYSFHSLTHLPELKKAMLDNFRTLEEVYLSYSEEDLSQELTSFWGVTYTRYEWLLEILAHVYHHRGQLHAILVHYYQKDVDIMLFE
ncbi:DinB family protein [Alkalicoccobacillus murimartini]|uniref:Damage-inducible protein DinB n=1 Tax=Alkalicoccobacillus murimartini TaxID=171685 RepID=A0ABT9YFL6_9BACI|nr:DinB family protein [Alkalicoccobacillus murimartini]MDQ0206627.1 putative damage-inducible protein DinB [Alkalicoccobacillus murimartini]